MPRQVRIQYAGALYHVMARGDHRKEIFRDDEDRQMFLAAMDWLAVRLQMGTRSTVSRELGALARTFPTKKNLKKLYDEITTSKI